MRSGNAQLAAAWAVHGARPPRKLGVAAARREGENSMTPPLSTALGKRRRDRLRPLRAQETADAAPSQHECDGFACPSSGGVGAIHGNQVRFEAPTAGYARRRRQGQRCRSRCRCSCRDRDGVFATRLHRRARSQVRNRKSDRRIWRIAAPRINANEDAPRRCGVRRLRRCGASSSHADHKHRQRDIRAFHLTIRLRSAIRVRW